MHTLAGGQRLLRVLRRPAQGCADAHVHAARPRASMEPTLASLQRLYSLLYRHEASYQRVYINSGAFVPSYEQRTDKTKHRLVYTQARHAKAVFSLRGGRGRFICGSSCLSMLVCSHVYLLPLSPCLVCAQPTETSAVSVAFVTFESCFSVASAALQCLPRATGGGNKD